MRARPVQREARFGLWASKLSWTPNISSRLASTCSTVASCVTHPYGTRPGVDLGAFAVAVAVGFNGKSVFNGKPALTP